MSLHCETTDLISFSTPTPSLPRIILTPTTPPLALLDFHLQTSPKNKPPLAPSISLDDIHLQLSHKPSPRSPRRSLSIPNLPPLFSSSPKLKQSSSCDNIHILSVLTSLDELLDLSLLESNQYLNTCDENEALAACLNELDDYLDNYTSKSPPDGSQTSIEIESLTSINSEEVRNRLRLFETNYNQFLASTSRQTPSRPTSACAFTHPRPPFCHQRSKSNATPPVAPSNRNATNEVDWRVISSPPAEQTDVEDDGGKVTFRESMRRLRHIELPQEGGSGDGEGEERLEVEGESVRVGEERVGSAPARLGARRGERRGEGRSRSSSRSVRGRSVSSSGSSVESGDSTPSGSPTLGPQDSEHPRRQCDRSSRQPPEMPETSSSLGQWPHSLSSMLACLGCTLGLFNISRFAILTVHFGANFIFQFLLLSIVFGLPLYTLQLCLGQQLSAGAIDMWRISPIFQGVGVALLLSQIFLGLYSIIGVSWLFVFFRDSFITRVDKYRWAEPLHHYRNVDQIATNSTHNLPQTIPDYFSGVVLQRTTPPGHSPSPYAPIKFQLAFNLAVVWMIVFVSLSKGLRSYAKVIYVFTLLPVFGTFVLCAKILGMMPADYLSVIFPETSWGEFFLNSRSWLAAAQECFLTWGVLGASIMQIASHNKHKHLLQRDSSLVAVITFTILILVALLANTCVQILRSFGFTYTPNSFESQMSAQFLRPIGTPLPPALSNSPVRYMAHNSFFLGQKIIRPGIDQSKESGYQVLRLATELIPATFAVLGAEQVSPFWAVLFYFILILFGIAQQLAIWHTVITGIISIRAKFLKSWETTITLVTCICGFLLGLPLATEFGIYIVYFMDYTIGGIWWLILVLLLQIIAVFMVRGRPYSGDTVVTALFAHGHRPLLLSWAPALLSFTWNVILPVALMVLCITTFRNGNFREIFIWHKMAGHNYWPQWAKQVGTMLELVPLMMVPLVAVVQSYRFLNNGPNDILERIQLLYRPPIGEHMTDLQVHEAAIASLAPAPAAAASDPPPKYTPPPSYTTATGARIAKFVRQSIRRSVRRLAAALGEGPSRRAASPPLPPPPPDYSAVLVEMSQSSSTDLSTVASELATPQRRLSTLERLRNVEVTPGSPTLTAAQVASILRSSFRRSTRRNAPRHRVEANGSGASLSVQNLVEAAAPIGHTSLVMEQMGAEGALKDNSSVI